MTNVCVNSTLFGTNFCDCNTFFPTNFLLNYIKKSRRGRLEGDILIPNRWDDFVVLKLISKEFDGYFF